MSHAPALRAEDLPSPTVTVVNKGVVGGWEGFCLQCHSQRHKGQDFEDGFWTRAAAMRVSMLPPGILSI